MNRNSKLYSVISYITWIGFLIALFARDKDDRIVRRHLNQALVLNIISTVSNLAGRLGGAFRTPSFVVDLGVLVLSIMGIVRAAKGSDEPLPVIGDITLFE